MRENLFLFFPPLIFLTLTSLFGLGDHERVTLTGVIRRVGNEPFTELVLTDGENRDWYIEEGEKEILIPFEQKNVTVTASVRLKRMILANGKELDPRRILFDLTLEE